MVNVGLLLVVYVMLVGEYVVGLDVVMLLFVGGGVFVCWVVV